MSSTRSDDVLRRIVATGTVETVDGQPITLHSQVSLEEGEFLRHVIREVRPTVSRLASPTVFHTLYAYMRGALKGAAAERHVAIDPYRYDVPRRGAAQQLPPCQGAPGRAPRSPVALLYQFTSPNSMRSLDPSA